MTAAVIPADMTERQRHHHSKKRNADEVNGDDGGDDDSAKKQKKMPDEALGADEVRKVWGRPGNTSKDEGRRKEQQKQYAVHCWILYYMYSTVAIQYRYV